MVSKQTRIWMVNGHEVQFDIVKFNHLFKTKAHENGMGITRYEEVVADALSVDSSTIHNWRFNLNGPSDPDKVYSLEKFWNVEENTLLKEVVMSKTEVTGLTDRELAALKNVYVSIKSFLDFYLDTNGFDREMCEWEQVETLWTNVKRNVEAEYIDLKKKLYDAIYEFVEKYLYETTADAYFEHHADPEKLRELDEDIPWTPDSSYEFYMTNFRKIIDPYLLA